MSDRNRKKQYTRAAYAPGGSEAETMIAILKEHEIDAFRQGGVRDIYKIGGDVFGEEIMVAPENLSQAQELLKQFPGHETSSEAKPASAKKTVLSLLAALALLALLLILRGRLLA